MTPETPVPPALPVPPMRVHDEACELSRQMLLALAREYDALDMCEAPVHWRHVAADLRRRVAMLPPAPAPPAPSGVPRAEARPGARVDLNGQTFVAFSDVEAAHAASLVNRALDAARELGRQDMDLTVGSLVSNLASAEEELRRERERNAPVSDVPKAEVFSRAEKAEAEVSTLRSQLEDEQRTHEATIAARDRLASRLGEVERRLARESAKRADAERMADVANGCAEKAETEVARLLALAADLRSYLGHAGQDADHAFLVRTYLDPMRDPKENADAPEAQGDAG